MLNEAKESVAIPPLDSPITADVVVSKTFASSESTTTEPPVSLPPPKLSSPFFRKKAKLQESTLATNEKVEEKQRYTPVKIGADKNIKAVANVGEVNNVGEIKKVGDEVNQVQSHRPSNPFAKASKSQDKSSLVDSLNKMKKIDNTAKR